MSPLTHGPRLNLTQVTTLRELARRGTLAAAADHLGYTPGRGLAAPRLAGGRAGGRAWCSGRAATSC